MRMTYLDDIDEPEYNDKLIEYFNNQIDNKKNDYQNDHYKFVIELLNNSNEDIDTYEKYKKMLQKAGYKNPVGLKNHYMKFLGFVPNNLTGRLTMTI